VAAAVDSTWCGCHLRDAAFVKW